MAAASTIRPAPDRCRDRQPGRAAEAERIAGVQSDGDGLSPRVVPPMRNTAVSPSESDRPGHRRSPRHVLMQAHARRRRVVVHEAGFRRQRRIGQLVPGPEQRRRHGGPRLAGERMQRLVAIALEVRDPASGPQFVIRTENGLPVRGITGVKNGAARATARNSSASASCAVRSR